MSSCTSLPKPNSPCASVSPPQDVPRRSAQRTVPRTLCPTPPTRLRFNKYFHRKHYFHRTRPAEELSELQIKFRELKKKGHLVLCDKVGGLDTTLNGLQPGRRAMSEHVASPQYHASQAGRVMHV